MSVTQSLLLALIAGFAYFARRFLGDLFLERAIVLGPVTGLILGDLETGLAVGAALELIFIGAADIGGSVPPNLPIGSVLGTAFAITAGLSAEQAVVLAVPAALLGSFGELFAKASGTAFVTAAERYADQASTRGITAMLHTGNLVHFLSIAIPTFLGLRLGTGAVQQLSDTIQGSITDGLAVAGAMLPAVGFALLLSSLATRTLLPFFFAGFLLAAYTSFGVLGAAVLGFVVAALWVSQKGGIQLIHGDRDGQPATDVLVTPAEQRRIFWRSFAVQSAFSFDRMQAMGFTWTLMPLLRRLYPDRVRLAAALRRHLVFFNTHPWIPGPVLALVSDLEARHAQLTATPEPTEAPQDSAAAGAAAARAGGSGPAATGSTATATGVTEVDQRRRDEAEEASLRTIQGIKGSLMGPLAGVGDSAFHGTLRPIFSGIGSSLALQGNLLAPLIFLIPVNAVHVTSRWVTQSYGFRLGRRLFERIDQSALKRLMEGASIAGLMGVGALVGTWLSIQTPLSYTQGEETVQIQEMLDRIMPKLIPLAVTLVTFWALRRRVHAVLVLLLLAVAGFALGATGVLNVPE